MKIRLINSTLSCILKCIRFFSVMINKKIIFGLFIVSFLASCSPPTAMLGPAYTLTSSGNIAQASLNYGSNQIITMYTGKTPIQNLKEISKKEINQTKNIKKRTLESDDFYFLVKNKIEKTRSFLKISNQ